MDKLKSLIKNNLDSIIKPVVVLLVICIVIPLALAVTNKITIDRIAELEIKQRDEAMSVLFEDASFEEKELTEAVTYFEAVNGEELIGYIFTTAAKGYGGDDSVSVMTAVNTDGSIKAIKILDVSSETPGLGQNAGKEDFYSQFTGMNGNISINKTDADKAKNEITPLAGATITSNAVKEAVNEALGYYETIASDNTKAKEVPTDEK